jgi:hypothetical protein
MYIYGGTLVKLCNENQLDALLPLIYFAKIPLHVSDVFIAHHQEVLTVYVQQLVRVMRAVNTSW